MPPSGKFQLRISGQTTQMKKTPINLSFNGKLIPCPNVSTKPEITSFPQLLHAGCEKANHNRLFTKKHPTKIKVGDAYALKQGWQDPWGSTHGDTPGLWCQQEPSPWKGPWSCSHLRHRNFINLAAISAKIGEVFGITRHKYKGICEEYRQKYLLQGSLGCRN